MSLNSSWNEKFFGKKVTEKIKIEISGSEIFVRKSCRFWDNVENLIQPDRSQMTIQYCACAMLVG